MGKKSQIDRAIEQLDGEIAVLQAAISKLRQQQVKAPTVRRRPRAVAMAAESAQERQWPAPARTGHGPETNVHRIAEQETNRAEHQ